MKLELDNEYNLNVVKEILATDDFLSMKKETIKCQNYESSNECVGRKYTEAIKDHCNCLPLNLRTSNKVKRYLYIYIYINSYTSLLFRCDSISRNSYVLIQ